MNSDVFLTLTVVCVLIIFSVFRSREAALAEEVRGLDARIAGLDRQLRSATQDLAAQRRQMQQLCDAEVLAAQLQEVDNTLQQKEQAFDEQQVRQGGQKYRHLMSIWSSKG